MRVFTHNTTHRRLASVLAAVLVMVSSGFGIASAQQNQGGSGLQLSPTRTELTASPGEVKEFSIIVKNVIRGDVSVKAFLNDFTADNLTGEPKLIVDEGQQRTGTSLEPFLKGVRDFDLKSGETKEVKLSVDFPPGTGGGGYFGAIRFVAIPKGEKLASDRQVALNASVASLALVELEGNIIEQIQVNTVKVRRGESAGTFFLNRPDKLAVDIQNKGNSFSKPFGRVQILGMNGSEVHSYELNNKDPRGNILPQSSRTFVDDISGIKTPGRYTAIVNVSSSDGGEIITQKVSFWYIPLWLIGVILLLLLLIGGSGYLAWRRRGQTRRHRRF